MEDKATLELNVFKPFASVWWVFETKVNFFLAYFCGFPTTNTSDEKNNNKQNKTRKPKECRTTQQPTFKQSLFFHCAGFDGTCFLLSDCQAGKGLPTAVSNPMIHWSKRKQSSSVCFFLMNAFWLFSVSHLWNLLVFSRLACVAVKVCSLPAHD